MSESPVDRLRGLAMHVRRLAAEAQQSLERRDLAEAAQRIDAAIAEAPQHAEVLRLAGLLRLFGGDAAGAVAELRKAAAAWPQDALIASNLGTALAEHGDIDAAIAMFRQATTLDATTIDAWYNLGRALEAKQDAAGVHAALSAVLELDPSHRAARILRADALKMLGALAEAEADLRIVLRDDPSSVPAWVALVHLKSSRVEADDIAHLERLHRSDTLAPAHRMDIDFAYASALEAAGRYTEAFDVFRTANAARRTTFRWNASAISALVDEILAAFRAVPAPGEEPRRGDDVAFLVGMPRSGSTLAEQILAAHPRVTGGGETGWVAAILQAESRRRGTRFPFWAEAASAGDWSRLGHEYLARVASRRRDGTLFTDKTPTNWQTLGAIRRMLPGARIVHCVRDPLETAWSCYKHDFAGEQLWSYDIVELAAFFGDEVRAMRAWRERGNKDEKEPTRKGVDTTANRVLSGEALAYFRASQREELLGIARFAQEYGFRPVIEGCEEGWTVADELGRAGAYAILTPRRRMPKDERFVRPGGASIENAALLHGSGVQVA
ncbi:MAG TPA: sulfotransferase, partial [Rhodanobacteraceae bacterium]|nr:sulfotransferase [Rhodanobacteraceae bacterium]